MYVVDVKVSVISISFSIFFDVVFNTPLLYLKDFRCKAGLVILLGLFFTSLYRPQRKQKEEERHTEKTPVFEEYISIVL